MTDDHTHRGDDVHSVEAAMLDAGTIIEQRPFVASAKIETFTRKRNELREAIRREGSPAIQDAWDMFEGFTDCISMRQVDREPNP